MFYFSTVHSVCSPFWRPLDTHEKSYVTFQVTERVHMGKVHTVVVATMDVTMVVVAMVVVVVATVAV